MWKGNAVPDFTNALEDYLASLPDEDWQALSARVRPPQTGPSDPKNENINPAGQFASFLNQQLNGDPS
jgi:hypothetical protein